MSRARAGKPIMVDVLTLVLLVATFAATLALYGRLPDPMPTHFDLAGHPNGWMSRPFGAWVMPVVAVGIVGLVRFAGLLLPSGWRERFEASPVQALALALAGLLAGIQVLLLRAALAPVPRLAGAIWVLIGGLFVVLGLLLPRTRRNPFFGVRTAFALASDENWARTQRVGGYAMTVGGFMALLSGLLGAPAIAFAAIAASAVVPAIFSWRLARRGIGDVPRISR